MIDFLVISIVALMVVGLFYTFSWVVGSILYHLMGGNSPNQDRTEELEQLEKCLAESQQRLDETQELLAEMEQERAERNAQARKHRLQMEQRWRSKLAKRNKSH